MGETVSTPFQTHTRIEHLTARHQREHICFDAYVLGLVEKGASDLNEPHLLFLFESFQSCETHRNGVVGGHRADRVCVLR